MQRPKGDALVKLLQGFITAVPSQIRQSSQVLVTLSNESPLSQLVHFIANPRTFPNLQDQWVGA